METQQVQPIQ